MTEYTGLLLRGSLIVMLMLDIFQVTKVHLRLILIISCFTLNEMQRLSLVENAVHRLAHKS